MGGSEVELVRLGYELFAGGDIDGIADRVAPDVEWREPDELPDAQVLHGREEVRRHLAGLLRTWERFHIELEDVSEPGEGQVLAQVRVVARGKRSGAEVNSRAAHLWTLRDGLATRVQIYGAASEG